jgi:hypothetical protein
MRFNQGLLVDKLKSSLREFYGRHDDMVDRYGMSVSQMITDMFRSLQTWSQLMYLGSVIDSCSTCDTRRTTVIANPVLSH